MKIKLIKKKADNWSNITLYQNCKHSIGSYWMRNGRRYTGLDKEDQERFEKDLGLDLRPESDFWDNPFISYSSRDEFLMFDTEDLMDELKYKFLKSHKRVANGYTDRKATAEYILVEENETAKEVNRRSKIKRKAVTEFNRLSIDEMRKALRLYGHVSKGTSNEVIESTLWQLVEDEPAKFLEIWVENASRETQFVIEEAVASGILRKNKTVYKYGSDIIGHTLEDAIDYLRSPKNNDLLISIKSRLEGKKDAFENTVKTNTDNKSEYSKLLDEINSEESKEEDSKPLDKNKSKKSK